MNHQLRADIVHRLMRDLEFEERGVYLQKGRCPECGKREAFIKVDEPWMVKCGRENKCGSQVHVKELFPELFDSWSERFAGAPVEQGQPQSTTPVADAYLQYGRGFELERIRGWYTQESFFDARIKAGTATVRFALGDGVWWERLIDKPERFGKQKANFRGAYKGQWWCPPAVDLTAVSEVWIVEGIFDAIALTHHGIAAVSAMSCTNYPDRALEALSEASKKAGVSRPSLVWALDTGRAGQEATLKHIRRAREQGWDCEAAQPSEEHDWNDLHQRKELTEQHLDDYRHNGALLIAPSANDKALLIYEKTEKREFPFEFRHRLYWFKLDLDKFQKIYSDLIDGDRPLSEREARDKALEQSGAIAQIANCYPTALYYQANLITDESWYYFRIEFPNDRSPRKSTFSGGQLAASAEFKKRLISIAPGAIWTGSAQQLDKLLAEQIGNIKTVETIDYIGFAKEHKAWVLGDFAVRDGKVQRLNDEDYFDFGRLSLKTLSQSVSLAINPNLDEYRTDWARMIHQAFGAKGIVALAFWLGSLFAEQIRVVNKSFPFLEIVGEAGAGKSTLLEFLWKLVGRRDYEGFDPSKATMPARARNFAQVSNLPVVLIESDRDYEGAKGKQFDWDELKTAYNGRSVRARGVKNNGNDTYEPPFRGAIVISQNAAVNASDAILQRIVHLHFTREGQTRETKEIAQALERMSVEELSGFILQATTREKPLLEMFTRQSAFYADELHALDGVRSVRIAHNHGQLAALLDCLGPNGLNLYGVGVLDQAHALVRDMAIERQQAINADHPIVQEFWETVDYIEGMQDYPILNHFGEGASQWAINLKHFEKVAADLKLRTVEARELKRHLKSSKTRKFVDASRNVASRIRSNGSTVRCWIFDKG